MSVAVAEKPSGPSETIARTVPLTALPNASRVPLELGEWQRGAPKLVRDMQIPASPCKGALGLECVQPTSLAHRRSCFRRKSSRCSLACQPRRFDHGLECLAGTQAGFDKVTARIRGTGWRWRNSRRLRTGTDDPKRGISAFRVAESIWGLFPCDGSHALQPCIAARVKFNLSLAEHPLCLQLEEERFSASGGKTNKSCNRCK